MNKKWVDFFIDDARFWAEKSKDPRKKVGCVIIDSDFGQLSSGYNGFARGVTDTDRRLGRKEIKNSFTIHAEANAVANAARLGHSLKGSIAFVTFPCCSGCANLLAQSGVREVYMPTPKKDSSWCYSNQIALVIFNESGVKVNYTDV